VRERSSSRGAALYGITAQLLDGQPLSLSCFAGRVMLIANTASQCGFTPQYAALEKLYRDYNSSGLEVLAFPSNQFGKQEPGSATDIAQFCERNFGVTFPVFAKIDVNGPNAHPIFRLLTRSRRGFLGTRRIKWNFTKFLVDRRGNIVRRYAPSTDPMKLRTEIEKLLAEPPEAAA
jgi:glutathione peroxidase